MRGFAIAAILLASVPSASLAQGADLDRRLDRMEREVRALQRQVFPGGNSEFFEPDIQNGANQPRTGTPASAPITDLTDRVNALENQLRSLTGQVEQNSFQLRQLQAEIEAMRGGDQTASGVPAGADTDTTDTDTASADSDGGDRTASDTADSSTDPASAEEPLPDDPGEASYVRGYRLWRDGNYEAARTQLRQTVEDYPGHRFESFARNLLGRAYLDDDKPANATEIFVRNYQELPNGARAADSLFFLGVALTELNYNERACLAFDELDEVYGEGLRGTIRNQVPAAREAASCSTGN